MNKTSGTQSDTFGLILVIGGIGFLLILLFINISKNNRKNDAFREKINSKEYKDSIHKAKIEADRLHEIRAEEWRKEAVEREKEWAKKNPKAARIKKKHPEWSTEDCERISEDKIWIGMSLDMLKYKRGLPDAANPSNYGAGTQWQWCWFDYTPSCYYDNDNDGLIDSYN